MSPLSFFSPAPSVRSLISLISLRACFTALTLSLPLSLALFACDDGEQCEVVNSPCDKVCDEGLTPVCVAADLCECVNQGGVAGVMNGGVMTGGVMSGGTGGAIEPPPSCPAPTPGSLSVNEVMVNPSGPEPQTEFVELVNLSAQEVDLTGLSVQYEGKVKRLFTQGCMAPNSAVALFSDHALTEWSTEPRAVAFEDLPSFGFANSRDAVVRLIDTSGATLSELVVLSALIQDGESATRSPEHSGEPQRHGEASPTGALLSPARCANLGSFEASCADGQTSMGGMMVGGVEAGVMTSGTEAGVMTSGTEAGVMVGGVEAGVMMLEGDPFGLQITELDYDQPSTDSREFIEIKNAGATRTTLAGLQLELINGNNNEVYRTLNLGDAGHSLDPGTYIVVGSAEVVLSLPLGIPVIELPNSTIQNGPDGVRLTFQGALVDEVGYDGYPMNITARDEDAGSELGLSRCFTPEGEAFILAPPSPARDNECGP